MSEDRDPVLAVDLDGTIIDPETEELIPGAKDAMIALHKKGWKIVIWTARGDADKFVPEVLERHGIPFDAVNSNLPGIEDKSRKIYFDAVVDNKNVDFHSGWEAVVRELENRRDGWKNQKVTKARIYRMSPETGDPEVVQEWELDAEGCAVLVSRATGEFVKEQIVKGGREFLETLVEENCGTFKWAELA